MKDTGIIVQARTGSTRFPRKVMTPFYRGKCLLEIVIEQLKKNVLKLPIIIATTESKSDDEIVTFCKNHPEVYLYRGSEINVLDRYVKAAECFELNNIIRVCSDNPFLQVKQIDELAGYTNNNYDYLSFKLDPDKSVPVITSHIGLFAELTTLKTLKKVVSLTKDGFYHEHVTNFIYENRDEFKVGLLNVSSFLQGRTDLRFTLDTKEDFSTLKELYPYYLQNKESIEHLVTYVDSNPEVLKKMSREIIKNSKK